MVRVPARRAETRTLTCLRPEEPLLAPFRVVALFADIAIGLLCFLRFPTATTEVYPGAAKPLSRPRRNCPEIHGASGLDGPDIPHAPRNPNDEKAVIAMARAIKTSGTETQSVYLVATGALTNVALLLSLFPELVPFVKVVIMGGAMGKGNTNPVAEFNIQCDPEAAHIVFESGADVTMVPLEVTHTALVTPEVRAALMGTGSRFCRLVDELLQFFADTYRDVFQFDDPPLHDPCAVFYVLQPDLFNSKLLRVDVETSSPLSAGQTICDVWHQSNKPPNVRVCTEMNVPRFWEEMVAAVRRADSVCPLL